MTAVLGLQLPGSAQTPAPPGTGFGEINRVGASVNYAGHPTINPSTVGFQDQPEADFRFYDDQLRVSLGLPAGTTVLAGPHRYQSNVPAAWSSVALRWASPDYNWGVQNMVIPVTSWAAASTGSFDATITSLLNSAPPEFTFIAVFAHEPENNGPMPNTDGGVWQNTNGPNWSRMQAHIAELFVTLNLPNCWLSVCHMGDTFPVGGAPGGLGNNNKDPEKWNAWSFMSAAAKARTIFGPDIYTKMSDDLGTSNSYTKLVTKYGTNIAGYVQAAGWGVQRFAITEHTINNDVGASDAHVAAAIRDDVRVELRALKTANKLAYYAHFNTSSGLASGTDGWFDLPAELSEFGALVREINTGATGGGTTGVAFVGSTTATANNSAPTLAKPAAAATGDYALVQFSCRDTVTLTDPAGWTVLVSTDIGGGRYRVYGKFISGSETTSNVVPSMGGTVSRWAATMLDYSGVHATPINGTPGVAVDDTANTVHVTGTTTTSVTGCTIVSLATDRNGTLAVGSWTPPAGYTGRASVVPSPNAGASAAAGDKANQPAGTYGGDAWATDVAVGAFVGVTMALRPA